MRTLRLRCLIPVSTVFLMVVGTAHATIILDNTILGSIVNNFEGIGSGVRNGILPQTGATYAERFAGQTLSFSGDFDILSGTPSGPLSLVTGAAGQNLFLLGFGGGFGVVLTGCGPRVCPAGNAIGEGAVSVLLGLDTDVFGLDIVGANGGTGNFDFFGRDGSLLGSFVLNLGSGSSFFGFRAIGGQRIAGVSLYNMDPAGVGFDNVTFNEIPEPSILVLFGMGLVSLGLARRRKTA